MNYRKPYIIAETAYTFEGDKDYLLEQVNELSLDIDAIKFHIMSNIKSYVVGSYSILNDLLEKWLLSKETWIKIISLAYERNFDVITLIDDIDSLEIISEIPDRIAGVEIHAACINDINLFTEIIEFCNENSVKLYIGASGFEINELDVVINFVKSQSSVNVVLMFGFQNFPTKVENVNLHKMDILRDRYNLNIGYADHTEYNNELKIELIKSAFSKGYHIHEIHYTLEEGVSRTDNITALTNDGLVFVKKELEKMYLEYVNYTFKLNKGEMDYLSFRKLMVYKKNYKKGTAINYDDIEYKRLENGVSKSNFMTITNVLGRTLSKNVIYDTEVLPGDFSRLDSDIEDYISTFNYSHFKPGASVRLNDYIDVLHLEYSTRSIENSFYEVHRNTIDIHYIIEGSEFFGIIPNINDFSNTTDYQAESDVTLGKGKGKLLYLNNTDCIVVNVDIPHSGGISYGTSSIVKKLVFKKRVMK
ncbi:YhcH/YjgK/YiaL family protein [Candidatus Xianfuyuplasma coldseepsis]|uniref:DUF386 family protein n=1 Tax=Candidatus Xianfuyuplasma coldseepsis TaxID=2782163 RepID=A0A7L7KP13_9MOLU|nr:YhcH/YjgK/YiaL family protein [Xianfuyuplasma coldseepsis]QMS84520.1 DUF386 family protein [Xianfuyuplasma coldseepsis]